MSTRKGTDITKNPKNIPKLDNFSDLLSFLSKGDTDDIEINHHQDVWENIPFIVPKSAFILERKILTLKAWQKSTDKQMTFLLSGDAWGTIKSQLETQKAKAHEFENKLKEQIEIVNNEILFLKEVESNRLIQEKKNNVEPAFYNQFFVKTDNDLNVLEHNCLINPLNENIKHELEEPRKLNLLQLQNIINNFLSKSQLYVRVNDIDNKIHSLEEKLEKIMQSKLDELNQKCAKLNAQITFEQKNVKEEIEKNKQEVITYISNDVITKINENEEAIKSNVDALDNLKNYVSENSDFKRKVNEKIEKIAHQNVSLFQTLEKKIQFFDQNHEALTAKAEQSLTKFRERIEERFTELRQESDKQLSKMNVQAN